MAQSKSPAVRNARTWARSLDDKTLARDIPHARKLWACCTSGRYDAYYPVIIGVYRAEQRRRAALAA